MPNEDGITMIITTIPPRVDMLCNRALPSVLRQTLPPDNVIIVSDHYREGAGPNRTRGLRMVNTEWVAYLDDDDELLPHHLEHLLGIARETDGDVIWPWFEMGEPGSHDPFPAFRGRQWDPNEPHCFPITALVRTKWAQQAEFPPPISAGFSGDDWPYWLKLSELGAKFVHTPERTWKWFHHFTNTSGAPGKW